MITKETSATLCPSVILESKYLASISDPKKHIVNDSIELIEEENNNYFLIKNKIGYDISIL